MHPLHLLAIGYIAGLLTGGLSFDFERGDAASTLTAAFVLVLSVVLAMSRRIRGKTEGLLAVLLVSSGLVFSFAVPALQRSATPEHHLLRHIPYERMNITGHLSRPVERNDGETRRPRIYIDVARALIRGVEVPMTGVVRITLASRLEEIPEVGDRLLIRRVRLRPPERFKNPGAFDYREFLRLRGVHGVGYSSVRNVHILEPKEKWGWRRLLFQFRERMSAHMHAVYPERAVSLIEAMTIGLREGLDLELKDAFRRSGAAHLLAISGLHVGFIAAFFFFALQGLLRRLPPKYFPLRPFVFTPSKLASLGVIPLVILFALLSGARISTVRATIMIVVYLLTRLLERPGSAIHSVLLAALIILLAEPGFIWDVGFQLSFVAVSAIVLAADRLPRPEARLRIWQKEWWLARAHQLAIIQLVVTAAITPLTAHHFHQAHPIGLIVNFLLIPLASLLVPLSFAASALAAVLPASMAALLLPATWLTGVVAQFMISVSIHSSEISWATIVAPSPEVWLIASVYALMALALRSRRARRRRLAWAGVCCLTVFLLLPDAGARPLRPKRTTLLLPDAGGVDAFFLRLPDGKGLVVDASGGRSSGFNAWESVLTPLMRREKEVNWPTLLTLSRYPKEGLAANAFASGISIENILRINDLHASAPRRSRLRRRRSFPRTIWRMSGGGARVSLLSWRKGAMGFEVQSPGSRWLLMLRSRYPAFDPRWFRGRQYDLVRLPESLLRKREVLDWLEARPPRVLLAAPQRVKLMRPDLWRETRRRQRRLGVYRPWRGGMLRVRAGVEADTAQFSVERFRAAEAWPGSGTAQWSAFRRTLAPQFSSRAERNRRAAYTR
ncbi:MAG: ComEC/Rec2 family competence protein [Nitrospinae bacterium]|nr:ComEC/Rec2 family competence protein [Nitrospinota bacterium]